MELVKITDLTARLGLSSRSLRYYEQVGLIESTRPESEKYRYYDPHAVSRLKEIIVLRKMQIPIKDILRIYESEDMSTVVEVFVERIRDIESEVDALGELKRIVSDFLQTMTRNGIKKISALPLIYEEMDRKLSEIESHRPNGYEELSSVSERLVRPLKPSIIYLPDMRVVSSYLKGDPYTSDTGGFTMWLQSSGLPPARPGQHERLEFEEGSGEVIISRVPDDFENGGAYRDYIFGGGLFASINVYLDEDLGERFRALISAFDDNKFYEVDYSHSGELRHPALIESLISPDDRRELVSLMLPVKKRTPDPALFSPPEELTDISISEIEAANPILWSADVQLGNMTQSHPRNSHFNINEEGDAEYISWILRAVLNTHVSVKLPFRIDMEVRLSGRGRTGVLMYHSEDTGYPLGRIGNRCFGVNIGNDNEKMVEAIRFAQPVFWDDFYFPGRGALSKDGMNRLTWIMGAKHLAVIINGEIRYCGINFPYMSLNLSREEPAPIVLGTAFDNDKVIFHSIRVSQLAETQKNKLGRGDLTMITRQSNSVIPVIHRLVTDEYGENYWFNGCAKYVMECLSEPDYDYWFFAGITGDLFTQHYAYEKSFWDAIDGYGFDENPSRYTKDTFAKCGYAATYVSKQEIRDNTDMYLNTLIAYIDRGIPVISLEAPSGVFVGYEEYGKVLLYITANKNQPERVTLDELLGGQSAFELESGMKSGWIFVGEKKRSIPLARIYREAIAAIPRRFSVKTGTYCFGGEAFRAWANDVEGGRFEGMAAEEFDTWYHYTNYICVLATNGSCCHGFLERAQALNPDLTWLGEVSELYRRSGKICAEDLQDLGGGFNVTLKLLKDREKCALIAAKIRECGEIADEIARIIDKHLG